MHAHQQVAAAHKLALDVHLPCHSSRSMPKSCARAQGLPTANACVQHNFTEGPAWPAWGMVGHLEKALTPSLMSGSASTFLLPYFTPARSSMRTHACMSPGHKGVQLKCCRTESEPSRALAICIQDAARHVAEATLGSLRDALHTTVSLGALRSP